MKTLKLRIFIWLFLEVNILFIAAWAEFDPKTGSPLWWRWCHFSFFLSYWFFFWLKFIFMLNGLVIGSDWAGRMWPPGHRLISTLLAFSAVMHVELITDLKLESQEKPCPMQWIFKRYHHDCVYSTLPRNIKIIARIKAKPSLYLIFLNSVGMWEKVRSGQSMSKYWHNTPLCSGLALFITYCSFTPHVFAVSC